ncbi:hypothetical protein ACNMZ4_06840 [Aerococcus urinaeequi]|uniref:hypothetical protein n=1 Tax=Aerococcus urinaeequi TaxID=51665 RepID=UPI003AAF114C
MMNYEDLIYEYSLESVSNSTVKQNMLTPNQGDVTVYIIEKTSERNISFSLYESGLAVYSVQTAKVITHKTNREFVPNGSGDLVVIDQA